MYRLKVLACLCPDGSGDSTTVDGGSGVPPSEPKRVHPHHEIVVIGAGAAGLGAASRLAEAGLDFVVLEAQDVPGGRIRTHHHGGFI